MKDWEEEYKEYEEKYYPITWEINKSEIGIILLKPGRFLGGNFRRQNGLLTFSKGACICCCPPSFREPPLSLRGPIFLQGLLDHGRPQQRRALASRSAGGRGSSFVVGRRGVQCRGRRNN